MCAPRTALAAFVFGLGVALNSVPQTTQRVAFSANLVPHVGQSLVVVVSGLIVRDYTMRRNYVSGKGKEGLRIAISDDFLKLK
jgi:hypothetical protein